MKIFTIDIEDWFHILDHPETELPVQWEHFESRIERNTDWILERLDETNQRATFFCLGWIAERNPSLIKKIAQQGHEIACHSMNHQLAFRQDIKNFREDLKQSLGVLEDITGIKIETYRAPGFSVSENNKWVFELLTEAGILNDCSVFPAVRNHGGYPGFGSVVPAELSVNGVVLREFPMSVSSFLGKKIVLTGGGYFRLAPYSIIHRYMTQAAYVMTYFHPRDFDAGQPVLKSLSLKRKMMSYAGLKYSGRKFERLLKDFRFENITSAVEKIDWNQAPKVVLK